MRQITTETELEALEKFENKEYYYPFVVDEVVQNKRIQNNLVDFAFKLKWDDKSNYFLAEVKGRSVPQVVDKAIRQIKTLVKESESGYYPAIVIPYINQNVFEKLKEENVSGFDLNGNYYINTPDITGIRLDKKNKYTESAQIKNIYRSTASTVGRFLMLQKKTWDSLNGFYGDLVNSGGKISLSAVSKILTRLSEELLVNKTKLDIRLIQPEKLVQNLGTNYKQPDPVKIIKLKLPASRADAKPILDELFNYKWIWTGESSADKYTVTTLPVQFSVFCLGYTLSDEIKRYQDEKFYNYIAMVMPEGTEYLFLGAKDNYASILQTYMELINLDKREKQIAEEIHKMILDEFYGKR